MPKRIAVLAALLITTGLAAAEAVTLEEAWEQTYAFAPGNELVLRNVNGSIEIEAWDQLSVSVEAEKKVRARGTSNAEEALAGLRIEVEESNGRLEIRTEHPKHKHGILSWLSHGDVSATVHYRVKVPREADLDVRTVNGRVRLAGVHGQIKVGSTNGKVEVQDAGGSLSARTTNGAISAELTAVDPGSNLELTTTNGGIKVYLPSEIHANVSARTTNGSIETDFPIQVLGRLSRTRLEGEINGGGGRLALHTTNGSIHIREN